MNNSGFAGRWETDFGTLDLHIQGTRFTGTYSPHDGHVDGVVGGNVLMGTWRQNAADGSGASWGDFTLTLTAGGQSFTGSWTYRDDEAPGGGTWNGQRSNGLGGMSARGLVG
jgi:hypothetical protein